MNVTMIGSHLCPDTFAAMSALLSAGVEVSYKDILSCHADLKTYLNLRDTSKLYADIRGTDRLGIPCFVLEDGTQTLDLAEVLKLAK
jgi:glutaredoxin-related protein